MCRRLAALVTAIVLMLTFAGHGVVFAAPGDDPAVVDGTLRVNLDRLGGSNTLTLPGVNHSYPLTLAVPDGTAPAALRGRVALPAYLSGGSVDVLQGDRLISRTPVRNVPNAPITLPLNGVQVNQNTHSADLTLRTHLTSDDFCEFDPDDGFRITEATTDFTGTPATPGTVGDFLPSVLTSATLYVPADPSAAEGAAAVDLAAAIVAHYSPAPVRITTRALPRSSLVPAVGGGPLTRKIVIAENLPEGLALADGGRYLTLGGPDLATEAAFLTTDLAPLAMATAAIPGAPLPAPQLPRDAATLADIGVRNQHITAVGWPTLAIGIDQTRLARPSQDLRIQLRGTYTPPPAGSGGQVVVSSGDAVVDSWPADSQGTFDRWVQVPNDLLNRFTELRVTVERGDSLAACGDAHRSSLSLSSDGRVESAPADPPLPPGFGSLPQSLMPRTQLAWTSGDAADVSRAVSVITGLQRMSAVPLGVDLVTMADLNPDLPAVLIAADGTGLPDLPLPVTMNGGGKINVASPDGAASVTNMPSTPFGSVQVLRADDRTVLVATSTGAPALLDEALSWLDDDADRWAALDGDALLQAGGQPPVVAAVPAQPSAAQAGLSTGDWIGVGAAVAVMVMAVLGGALIWRRRRTAPADHR